MGLAFSCLGLSVEKRESRCICAFSCRVPNPSNRKFNLSQQRRIVRATSTKGLREFEQRRLAVLRWQEEQAISFAANLIGVKRRTIALGGAAAFVERRSRSVKLTQAGKTHGKPCRIDGKVDRLR